MKLVLACVGLICAAGAACAKPVIYDCTIPPSNAGGGYIQPQMVVSHDVASGSVLVYDALIETETGAPLAASITEETPKRLTITWKLVVKDNGGNVAKMDYRAVYLKGDKSFLVSARPSGFDNQFQGRGSCKVK